MERKVKVLGLLGRTHAEQEAWAVQLPEVDKGETGTPQDWAAKDILAHIAAWEQRLAQNLVAVRQGTEPLPPVGDVDFANGEIFCAHRDDPWEKVAAYATQAHRDLVEQTEALDPASLESTELLRRQGRPLWRQIVGNGCIHPVEHLALHYARHGQVDRGTRLEEETAALLWDLDDSPDWRGMVRYNQCCHHALAGAKERALSLLAEALALEPGLRTWSRQDTDLDSLRDEPGYQTLVDGTPS